MDERVIMIGFDDLGNKGWLGNTMFQYASLRGISANKGYDFCIPPNDSSRVSNYLLHDIFKLFGLKYIDYIGKPTYRHSTSDDPCHSTTFNFNEKFFEECPDNVNISGFFQSEKWFKHIENEIKNDFTFKDYILNPCLKMLDTFDIKPIFLHVRRNDYLKRSDYHYNLTLDYFEKALSFFDDDIPVLIFSDDIDWCKNQTIFNSDRFNFSETEETLPSNSFIIDQGYEKGALIPQFDLCLMTLCDGGIISNSSFSWWGAWLQNSRSRSIICPNKNKWAGPKNKVDYSDIIPYNWEVV
jgi:hypothetical protein